MGGFWEMEIQYWILTGVQGMKNLASKGNGMWEFSFLILTGFQTLKT